MSKPLDTNKDLLIAIYEQTTAQTEQITALQSDMTYVKRLAEKTNGRVTTIENWKTALEAIEGFKDKQVQAPTTNIKATTVNVEQPKWFSTPEGRNVLVAVAAILTAVATILTVRFGV